MSFTTVLLLNCHSHLPGSTIVFTPSSIRFFIENCQLRSINFHGAIFVNEEAKQKELILEVLGDAEVREALEEASPEAKLGLAQIFPFPEVAAMVDLPSPPPLPLDCKNHIREWGGILAGCKK